jgi:hypothetical protein
VNSINYLEILKKSWSITWNNKYLWWFGFFLALGINGLDFNGPFNSGGGKEKEEKIFNALAGYFDRYQELIISLLIVLLLISISLVILKIICRAGLIKSVAEIEKGKIGSFKTGFKEGKKYFWKLLGTDFIVGFFFIIILIVLFSPIAFLIYLKSYWLALVLGILATIIIIALAILVAFLKEYACIYLVLSDISIRSALESGYQLFLKNFWPSIIFSIIFIPIALVLGLGILMTLIILAVIFGIIGVIFYLILAKIGAVIIAVLGILFFLILTLVLQSIFETFKQASWVLFFHEIATVKKEETIQEEVAKVPEKALEGGEA